LQFEGYSLCCVNFPIFVMIGESRAHRNILSLGDSSSRKEIYELCLLGSSLSDQSLTGAGRVSWNA
jgi:hypothetical protein